MNEIIQEHHKILQIYQPLRNQLMEILTDVDLAFCPGGSNPTLGELCRDLGEVEHAYIQSFETFVMDFSYRHENPNDVSSVKELSAWFAQLDRELGSVLASISDEDVKNRVVDRDGDFKLPAHIHLEVYREALSIFHGKVSVYLKAMCKEMPQQWQEWIG